MNQQTGFREAILSAATQLFHERGFSRTTTDEIAEKAGITKRTLYRYMDSKETILLAIHEQFLERVIAPVDLPGSPEDRLVALIENYVETVSLHRDEIRVFFEERKHLSPANLERVIARRDDYERGFRDTLADGMRAGLFRDLDITLASEAVLGAIASLYEWYRPAGRLSASEMSQLIARLVLDGLAATASSADAKAEPGRAIPRAALPETDWADNPVLVKVLSVAADMFYKHGYDKTSTRELADAAGLTKSALYYYIPNKESVLFQVSLKITIEGIQAITQIVDDEPDPVAALRQIFEWQTVAIARNLGALRALNYEMRFLDPVHLEKIVELRARYADEFRRAVQAACGDAEPLVRRHVATTIVIGMLNFMNQWYAPGGRLSPEEIGAGFFDLMWNGLRNKQKS